MVVGGYDVSHVWSECLPHDSCGHAAEHLLPRCVSVCMYVCGHVKLTCLLILALCLPGIQLMNTSELCITRVAIKNCYVLDQYKPL